jgi:hypothetical protein
MFGVYLTTYAHTQLGYSRAIVLFVGVLGGLTRGHRVYHVLGRSV